MIFLESKEVSFHPVWLVILSVTSQYTVNRKNLPPTQSEYHLSQVFAILLRNYNADDNVLPLIPALTLMFRNSGQTTREELKNSQKM